jgi:hypothetical protein
MSSSSSCNVEGNGDFYGLGIRIGVYLSITATLYAKYHLSSALPGMLITNGIFVFALLITVSKNAVSQELRPIDGYIMLQVIFGYILCGAEAGSTSLGLVATILPALTPKDYQLGVSQLLRPPLATLALSILRAAIASFNVWFWFYGINHLQGARTCELRIFFFRNYDGYGNIQVFFKFLAATYLGYQVLRQFTDFILTRRAYHSDLESSSKKTKGDNPSGSNHEIDQPMSPKRSGPTSTLQSTFKIMFSLVTTTFVDQLIEDRKAQ